MTQPGVESARQIPVLLVNWGHPTALVLDANSPRWGATLGGTLYVWRSALRLTARGALVYAGGPGLGISDLATSIMVRAGAERAMELGINTDWVNYSVYSSFTPTGPASAVNGTLLFRDMTDGIGSYFASTWARDFITMSATS